MMIGRRFFSTCLEKFRRVCQTLSCRKEQLSPVHSVGNHPDVIRPVQSVINTVSEEVKGEDMGNKALKLPDIDASAYQDHVLNMIEEQITQSKETNFSPYTPLPAIGKSSLEGPKRKIVRQKTYRVLEPIYIKGPSDLSKYISKTENELEGRIFGDVKSNNFHLKDQNNTHRNQVTFKKERLTFNNDCVKTIESTSDKNLKERYIQHFYCKSASEHIVKKETKKLSAINKDQLSKNIDKENATSFWIDF